MAKVNKFVVVFPGTDFDSGNRPLVETVLKKSFSPSQFDLHSCVPERPGDIRDMGLEAAKERLGGRYGLNLPQNFQDLEARLLYAFKRNETADIAIAVETGTMKDGDQYFNSHLEGRALLFEAIGQRSWDPFVRNFQPYFSRFYIGGCPATERADLVLRCQRTVLRGAIEGWESHSRSYDGLLRKRG